MSHLSSARVNLAQLREATRRKLLFCLDKCTGSKAIIWDDKLTGCVSLIAEYSLLKEHEVGKMFTLAKGKLQPCDEHNLVYFVRPKLETMEIVAGNIKEERAKGSLKEFHIFFVPYKSKLCENKLKEYNVYGDFTTIEDFDMSLIPFENDVLSLEQEKAFYECYVENDFSSLHQIANSLMTLQALYGVIPHILGKGEMSAKVTEIMLRKRKEMVDYESHVTPLIDTLLLVDRNIDLITPLLSQLVYEGLIDEIFKLENTNCQLPSDCISGNKDNRQQQSPEGIPKTKVVLNSSDDLFAELRSMNFSAVASVLSREAKRLAAEQEEHRTAKTVGEMKQFVHKLPHIQAAKKSLYLHTGIAEKIKEKTDSDDFRDALGAEQEFFNGIDTDKAHPYIEKCIATKEPLIKVLRLVCLQCCTNNGFKIKLLDYYKREIFHTYGLELLSTFLNLEKVGLLRPTALRNYPTLKKNLKLVVEGVHEQNPNDIAYVHSGYAPISIRLAQFLERSASWKGMEELLKLLPGPNTEEVQDIPVSLLKKAATHTGTNSSNFEGPPKVTLVYFIGGCTYSEISALRFLAQQENAVTSYIIATTKIINGNDLMESLIENFAKAPISA